MYQEPVMTSSILLRSARWLNDRLKRIFDIIVSSVVLLFLTPFWGLIALAIKRDSPGPVIYRGTRFGLHGKPFQIIKFRTMYENPESYLGPGITAHDDPRVTPLGRWLRDTKLNELPQFWNVLKGEMSLVGPRPEDPNIAKTWPQVVRQEVLSVRPGITSPASVQYHNEESLLSADHVFSQYMGQLGPDKMRLDQLYVRNRSFWLDLDTLLWTLLVLLPKLSSQTIPEELLFVGPVTRLIRRHVSWFTIDLFVTLSAIAFTGILWRMKEPLHVGWPKAIAASIVFAFLFSLTGALTGVHRITWSKAAIKDMFDLVPAWSFAFVLAFIANGLIDLFPPLLISFASILALFGYVVIRYRGRLITGLLSRLVSYRAKASATCERVLILGSGANAQHVAWLLDHPRLSQKFQIVGLAADNIFDQGMRIYGAEVLGSYRDVPELVKTHDVGIIFQADQHIPQQEYQLIEDFCSAETTRLVVVPDIISALGSLEDNLPTNPQTMVEGQGGQKSLCMQCLVHHSSQNGAPSQKELDQVKLASSFPGGDD